MQQGIDNNVLQQCLQGDERGYYALYQSLFSYLMNICIRYNRDYDEAGLALNEIFLKIVNGLSDYENNRPFLPWVKTIAIRFLIDRYRSQNKQRQLSMVDDEINESSFGETHYADSNLRAKDLLTMIHKLPNELKHVFNLFAIDGYTHAEIAELLGVSPNTSKWYVAEARKNLKQQLKMEEERLAVKR